MRPISLSFPQWSKNQIKNYFTNFLKLRFKKGDTVFADKSVAQGFYLVKEGIFTSFKLMSLSEMERPAHLSHSVAVEDQAD